MRLNQNKPRVRWGVQRDMRDKADTRPIWTTLGTGWHPERMKVPAFVDYWPMSFQTRREARDCARQIVESSTYWTDAKCRAVKLTITIRVAA